MLHAGKEFQMYFFQKVKKNIEKVTTYVLCLAAVVLTNIERAYCDIFDEVQDIATQLQWDLVDTVTVLFPLVAMVDIGFIIFTRDQRKIQMELFILGASILGFIAMLVINGGSFVETLQNLVGQK